MDKNITIEKKEIAPGIFTTGGTATLAPMPKLQQEPIDPNIIGNTKPTPIPPVPPATDYSGVVAGLNTGAIGKPTGQPTATATTEETAPETSLADTLKEMLALSKPPVNQAEIYKKEAEEAQIKEKKQLVNSLTSQINAIVAQSQAEQLALTGQGRGIPLPLLRGQAAEISKQAAIRTLPLSAQLSAAQNDLNTAQSHLDSYFKIVVSDAENQVNYYNKAVELAYSEFSKAEQKKLDSIKTQKATDVASMRDAVNNAQQLALKALETGNTAQYNSLISLPAPDPNSRTFAQDLANYNTKVAEFGSKIVDPKRALEVEQAKLNILKTKLDMQKTRQDISDGSAGTSGKTESERQSSAFGKINQILALPPETGFKDKNGFITAQGFKDIISNAREDNISRADFLKEYAYLLYPKGGKAYGLSKKEMEDYGIESEE